MRLEPSRGPALQRGEVMPRFGVPYSGGPMERILVVEDDRAVQKALKRLFEAEGFAVEISADGKSALEAYRAATPVRGRARSPVARHVRAGCLPGDQATGAVPPRDRSQRGQRRLRQSVAAGVGRGRLCDQAVQPARTSGAGAGGVAAQLRGPRPATSTAFDGISVDFTKMEVTRDGQAIGLTAQEFKTLKFMMRNAERVISRDELLNEVWGYQNYPSTRTVDNHILKLRQKLEKDPANPVHFRTVHGMGYKFVPLIPSERRTRPAAGEMPHAETSDAHQVSALHAADLRRTHLHQPSAGAAQRAEAGTGGKSSPTCAIRSAPSRTSSGNANLP